MKIKSEKLKFTKKDGLLPDSNPKYVFNPNVPEYPNDIAFNPIFKTSS